MIPEIPSYMRHIACASKTKCVYHGLDLPCVRTCIYILVCLSIHFYNLTLHILCFCTDTILCLTDYMVHRYLRVLKRVKDIHDDLPLYLPSQ